MKRKSIASEMVFLLKYRKTPRFRGAYIQRGLCTEGNWPLKIDWTSLILGRNVTVFLCFTLYLNAISKYKPRVDESTQGNF